MRAYQYCGIGLFCVRLFATVFALCASFAACVLILVGFLVGWWVYEYLILAHCFFFCFLIHPFETGLLLCTLPTFVSLFEPWLPSSFVCSQASSGLFACLTACFA